MVRLFFQRFIGVRRLRLRQARTFLILGILCTPIMLHAQSTGTLELNNKAEQLLQEGLELKEAGNFDRSNSVLEEAAALFHKLGAEVRTAHCFNHITSNLRRSGRLDAAEDFARKALEVLSGQVVDDPTEYIRAYTNMGLIATLRARYDVSMEWLNKARGLLDHPSVSPYLKTTVLGSLGYVQDDMGNYDQALSLYYTSLDILSRLEDPPKARIAKLYNNIGYSYNNLGRYDLGLKYYKKELALGLQIRDDRHPDVGIAYLNIGSSHYRRGDCGQAILYFQKSLDIALDSYGENHEMTLINYDNMALCYIEDGRFEKAVASLKRSVQIKKSYYGLLHPKLAKSYKNLGRAYAYQKKYEQATEYYKKALSIQRQSLGNRHPELVDTYNNIGLYFAHDNQPDSALHYLNKATRLGREVFHNRHPVTAQTYAARAKAAELARDYQNAILNYQRALQLLSEQFTSDDPLDNPAIASISYPGFVVDIFFGKARMLNSAYHFLGNTDYLRASLTTFQTLLQLLDQMQAGYINRSSKLAIGRKSHSIYEHAIQVAFELYQLDKNHAYLETIFRFAEKSKARILLRTLALNSATRYAGVPDSLLAAERALKGRIKAVRHQINLQLSSTGNDQPKLTMLRDSLLTLNRRLSDYSEMIGRKYPRYHALKFSSFIPSLKTVQQHMRDEQAVILEYFLGQRSLYALIVAPEQITVQKLTPDQPLSTLIAAFNNAITERDNETYKALGYRLHQLLIEPVERFIPSSGRLIIVPDGELALLPFEALLTHRVDSSTGEFDEMPYLLHSYNIAYSPSIAMSIVSPHKTKTDYETGFLAFAPGFTDDMPNWNDKAGIVSRSDWTPLHFSKIEVTDIAALFYQQHGFWDYLFGNEQAELFLGRTATESALKTATGLNSRYIHLATHAFVSENHSELAGILLYPGVPSGEDGILYAYEIYGLSVNTELLVLSACETGRGSVVKGEGIMSLSRAFRYAGAPSMLVSLWKVEDRSTARLMVEFYRKLLANKDKEYALQAAKKSLIQGVEFAHPFYWAPFILIES